MPEMKFFIIYNNIPFVDGETLEPIYFNNFEAANTLVSARINVPIAVVPITATLSLNFLNKFLIFFIFTSN